MLVVVVAALLETITAKAPVRLIRLGRPLIVVASRALRKATTRESVVVWAVWVARKWALEGVFNIKAIVRISSKSLLIVASSLILRL